LSVIESSKEKLNCFLFWNWSVLAFCLGSPAPLKYISDVTSAWHHASPALIVSSCLSVLCSCGKFRSLIAWWGQPILWPI
jgi:hypothetical protein